MIKHGAEKIISSREKYVNNLSTRNSHLLSFFWMWRLISDDIDATLQRGEEHTIELNSNMKGWISRT